MCAMEIVPVLPPQSGEKQPECPTRWLLELLLTFMVSEVRLRCLVYVYGVRGTFIVSEVRLWCLRYVYRVRGMFMVSEVCLSC